MGRKISAPTMVELLEALRCRYRDSTKKDKARILDEFVALTGYHRKHAIRVLGHRSSGKSKLQICPSNGISHSRRIYDEAVKQALIVVWEASDRICGKRLKAIIPDLVDAMERHGHLDLDSDVRKRLLSASAATIDRLLAPVRSHSPSRRKRRRRSKVSKRVPVRTFADWNEPIPGFFEIDFVVHCGGSMADSFIHTLVATDICSGWTECVPLLVREQSLVVEALDALCRQVPLPVLGIDSDNDGAFINDSLLEYCEKHQIEFTRSRAYRKNDQAWVEQKNGAVVRRMVGYERFSGVVAGQALANLYQNVRLYVNYFQPSFKLRGKVRNGAKVTRSYDPPATPCERLLKHLAVDEETKEKLQSQRWRLDPVELLYRIREGQAALTALVSEDAAEGPGRKTLDEFLSQLPKLWRSGEVRPTHVSRATKPRHWRTRKDPFETVWFDILRWLQHAPDSTAKALFERLQREHPGRFPDGQLRTFQRRVREWRQVMARKLVYACMGENVEPTEPKAMGASRTL
jgi:hypothetical protein